MRHLRWCWGQTTHPSSRGWTRSALEAWRAAADGWSSSRSRLRQRSESPDLQTPSQWGSPVKKQRETSQSGSEKPEPHANATQLNTYFPRVLGTYGDTKLWSDESVVNEFGHVLKRLAVVLTGGQNPKWTALTSPLHTQKKGERSGLTFGKGWIDRIA